MLDERARCMNECVELLSCSRIDHVLPHVLVNALLRWCKRLERLEAFCTQVTSAAVTIIYIYRILYVMDV